MPLQNAAGDDVEAGGHLLEGMTDHVAQEEVVVAPGGEARHQGAEAAMHGGEQAVRRDRAPESFQRVVVEGEALVTLRSEAGAFQPEPGDVLDLSCGELRTLQWHD